MDFKLLNPGVDSWNSEEVQKENVSNKLNKRIFVLILLLVIIAGGVFLYQRNPAGKEYVERIKSVLSEKLVSLKAMIAPELDLSEDSGLDLSEVNVSAFVPDGASADKENLLAGGEEEEEEPTESPSDNQAGKEDQEIIIKLTLSEIKEMVSEIAEKTEKIKQEVKRLTALAEIQKEIDAITQRTETLGQKLDTLKVLAASQEKVDSFAEETELSNQETT